MHIKKAIRLDGLLSFNSSTKTTSEEESLFHFLFQNPYLFQYHLLFLIHLIH
jgi:hypothetical protein